MPKRTSKQKKRRTRKPGRKQHPLLRMMRAPPSRAAPVDIGYCDTTFPTTAVTTTGAVSYVVGIAEGTDNTQRLGRAIRVLGYFLNFTINCADATITDDRWNTVRVMLVRDNACAGAAPTPAQILWRTGTVDAPNSPMNQNWWRRFEVLFDTKRTVCNTGPVSANIGNSKPHLCSVTVRYGGTTAAVTDCFTDGLFLLVISDSGAAPNPGITGTIRILYVQGY